MQPATPLVMRLKVCSIAAVRFSLSSDQIQIPVTVVSAYEIDVFSLLSLLIFVYVLA